GPRGPGGGVGRCPTRPPVSRATRQALTAVPVAVVLPEPLGVPGFVSGAEAAPVVVFVAVLAPVSIVRVTPVAVPRRFVPSTVAAVVLTVFQTLAISVVVGAPLDLRVIAAVRVAVAAAIWIPARAAVSVSGRARRRPQRRYRKYRDGYQSKLLHGTLHAVPVASSGVP